MVEEYGWSIVISVYLVYGLGLGVIIIGILYVWTRAIDLFIPLFNFHREFIAWVYVKYRKKRKVLTPKINSKEDEE